MELMLTGDSMSGEEAATMRWANRCFENDALEANVLEIAQRVAKIPSDLLQVHGPRRSCSIACGSTLP